MILQDFDDFRVDLRSDNDIHKANFLAGRIERPGPAHGSPSAVTERTHGQNEPNSVDLGSTPTFRILRVIASYSARIPAL